MRRKIRTVNEEMDSVLGLILFACVWYIILIKNILTVGFHAGFLIFLIGGILPLAQAVRKVQKALYYRKFHQQCMQERSPSQGRIVNIVREYYNEYDSRNRRRRIPYYFLIVEVTDFVTGSVQTIKSEPYRIPLYKYLASPYVQVYTDQRGWKHVIDGFQLKHSRTEPDIPLENSNVYLRDFQEHTVLFKAIYVIILVLIVFQILGIL
ncbi:MAG: hypothetical protein Q4C52_02285 [Eubacteriales bacterium]|nr:hypothetical protein [Eubacteriales bacterium]